MKSKTVLHFFYPFILMLLIFVESSIPGQSHGSSSGFVFEISPVLQNLLHIPIFAFLSYLFVRAFYKWRPDLFYSLVSGLFFSLFYGFLDEFHQTFVPGRYGSLQDIILDAAGVFTGGFIFVFFKKVSLKS